jgi:hypothetical protein
MTTLKNLPTFILWDTRAEATVSFTPCGGTVAIIRSVHPDVPSVVDTTSLEKARDLYRLCIKEGMVPR